MSSDAESTPRLTEKLSKKNVRFFNVSLKNGIVMSTPSYPEKQTLCASLIRAVETSQPDFAWIQFLFLKTNYGQALTRLKNSLLFAKTSIEQPSLDVVSGETRVKRELRRDYYSRADSRMKKIDEIATKPTITMAIQGMWVTRKAPSSIRSLPFDHCFDEHDGLAVFQYRDPRMLLELVDRAMVEDISGYLDRFTGSRVEPPSLIVTPEELACFVHLPAGEQVASIGSLGWGTLARGFTKGAIAGEARRHDVLDAATTRLVRIAKVPKIEEVLEDDVVQPLAHLASDTVRTFEVVYTDGKTDMLLSSKTADDMRGYADLFNSVYGELKYERVDPMPDFLKQLPGIVGLRTPTTQSA